MNGRKHDCRRYGHVRPSECRPQRPPNAAYSFPPASVADFTSQINTFIRKTPSRAGKSARSPAGPPLRNGNILPSHGLRAKTQKKAAPACPRPQPRLTHNAPGNRAVLPHAGQPRRKRALFQGAPFRRKPCPSGHGCAASRAGRLKRERLPGKTGKALASHQKPLMLRPCGPWLPSRFPHRNAWRQGYVRKVHPASSPGVRPRCG